MANLSLTELHFETSEGVSFTLHRHILHFCSFTNANECHAILEILLTGNNDVKQWKRKKICKNQVYWIGCSSCHRVLHVDVPCKHAGIEGTRKRQELEHEGTNWSETTQFNRIAQENCFKFHTFGLYSAFLACNAIFFKSSLHPRFTVDTMFLKMLKDHDLL